MCLHLWHNSSVWLIIDGRMISVLHEEKFDNIKNSSFFPSESIKYLVEHYQLEKIDKLVISSSRLHKGIMKYKPVSERDDSYKKLYTASAIVNRPWEFREYLLDKYFWKIKQKGYLKEIIKSQKQYIFELAEKFNSSSSLIIREKDIFFSEHHISHTLSPVYFYGLHLNNEPILILSLDGSWDKFCAMVSIYENGELKVLSKSPSFASIGYLWAYVTMWLGMTQVEHEYKVMGLAAYAQKKHFQSDYEQLFKDIIRVDWLEWKSSIPLNRAYMYLKDKFYGRRFDNIAWALQFITEDLVTKWIRNAVKETNISKIAVSWGVFMNVKLNQKIQNMTELSKVYFMPSSWDESNVIWAAFYEAIKSWTVEGMKPIKNMYLWIEDSSINEEKKNTWYYVKHIEEWNIPNVLADLLMKGEVIGICRDKGEWGARSLGNRAIIANPTNSQILHVINNMIKLRDFRMPFAPTILEEYAEKYIQNREYLKPKITESSRYMITATDTTDLWQKHLQAAVHPKDKTIRPQVLYKDDNEWYYNTITEFSKISGVWAVLNTSLNIHWYPMVGTQEQALFTFENSGLKYILIDNSLYIKNSII